MARAYHERGGLEGTGQHKEEEGCGHLQREHRQAQDQWHEPR